MTARVAVLAGRGKTGRAVRAALSARGAEPVPLGREDWRDLTAALRGCDAVYVIAPNMAADEPGYVDGVLDAARGAGVSHLVYHSVAAPYAPAMPHHLGKARAEDRVRRAAPRWTILQPCAYAQNFVPALRGPEPALRVAYDPQRLFGLVDLADVAQAAACVLLEDHAGATYELGGPRQVRVHDVAAAASSVLGRPVPVEQVGARQWESGEGAALEERERSWLLAMFDYYDRYGLPASGLALRGLLGREPTALTNTLARELRADPVRA